MKYLIIAAVAAILFAFIYLRIRPYLKLIQKVRDQINPQNKVLVRCDRCGTWIPSERALKLSSGLATFCSTECMAAKPASKRKVAG